jgi:hypothetical protein
MMAQVLEFVLTGIQNSGGHYNIEVFKAKIDGRSETIKLKVEFDCAGRKCTEAEVLSMVNQIN